ncbi:Transcription factor bye1 [Friedmanniomyces endolithicus]|nr:Transcription factor bye1 [Friedmanniomyces endolithicus]
MSEPSSSSPMVTAASTPATSPISASSSSHFSQSDALASEPELERADLGRPGTSSAKSPPSVHVDRNVSALAGRGMHVPVKLGTKRAAPEAPEANDSVVGSPINKDTPPPPAQPPSKRLKLNGPRDPSLSPSKAASPPAKASSKAGKSKSTTKQQPSSGAKVAQQAQQPSTKKTDEAPRSLESVIAGTRLPATEAEAKQAAALRHERLLAQHNKASTNPEKQKKKTTTKTSRTTPAAPAPDFPPEFFNPANFAPGQEEDSVRCVCGVIADDGADMVSCDECLVWQHTRCMGEGVPKEVAEERYVYQVCSPWMHRRLIARLRKGAGV